MIVTSALDASRNWSSALSRFGFGVLILAALSKFAALPAFLDISRVATGEITLAFLPSLVFWIMISMVLGALAIMLGSIGETRKFGELAKARRAYRVGKSGNPLLAELLRDATGRYELAAGFSGVFYILLFVLGLSYLGGLVDSSSDTHASSATNRPQWLIGLYGGVGGLTAYLIQLSAKAGIEAIDTVLDQYYPEETDSQ